jgi:hypothetical protein
MPRHSDKKERIPEPGEPFPQEHPETHFERKDRRWGNHLRDWGYLAVMMVIYLVWTLSIYFLEPGIR